MNEKPYYEKEISLWELFLVYLEKWRSILIAVLLGALLLCAYKYYDMVSESRTAEGRLDTLQREIEANEQQRELLETFQNESTIMSLNAYGVWKQVDTYCMDATDEQAALLESFVLDGAMYQKLSAESGYLIPDLEQIVLFNGHPTDNAKRTATETEWKESPGNVFRITVFEKSQEQASELAGMFETAIAEYLQQFSVQAELVQTSSNLTFVPEILDIQKDFENDYEKISNELTKSRAQLQESTEKIEGVQNKAILLKELVKFGIGGGILGFILITLFWILRILISSRILFLSHFEESFSVRLLGYLPQKEKTCRVDRWIERKERGGLGQLSQEELRELTIANLQKTLHKEKEVKKVFLSGTLKEEIIPSFEQIRTELQKMGYEASGYEKIYCTPKSWKRLEEYDAILFAEKRAVSNAKDVLQEIEIAKELDLKILGVVIC